MGWIEETEDGRRIHHEYQLAAPDGELSVPGDALDWWLTHGAVGAPLRTACTCGWISPSPGPSLPALPPPTPGTDRVVRAWTTDGPITAVLPWHFVRDFEPGPELASWLEYHLRAWQTHVADVLEGTNADDPEIHALRRAAALLDDVEDAGVPALAKLRRVADAIAGHQRLAVAAARRQGKDWRTIAWALHMDDDEVQTKYGPSVQASAHENPGLRKG